MAQIAIVDLFEEALNRFDQLVQTAKKTEIRVPLSMALATVDNGGRPSVRTVMVKNYDRRGFVFFTHQRSRKGLQIDGNPHVALCFFCQPLMEQVTIEGLVELVKDHEADAYWSTRARDAQFAAWASCQSEPLDSRESLQNRLSEYQKKYADQRVPRPPMWVGYRVIPNRIEFWRAGWRYLHERVCYSKADNDWNVVLLNP